MLSDLPMETLRMMKQIDLSRSQTKELRDDVEGMGEKIFELFHHMEREMGRVMARGR